MSLDEELDNLNQFAEDVKNSSVRLPKSVGNFLYNRLSAHLEAGGLADPFDMTGAPAGTPSISTYKDARDTLLTAALPAVARRATSYVNQYGQETEFGDAFNQMFTTLTNNLSEPIDDRYGTFHSLVNISARQATNVLQGGKASWHGQGEGITPEEMANVPASMLTNPTIQRAAGEQNIPIAEAALNNLMGIDAITHGPATVIDRFLADLTAGSGSPRPLGLYSMNGRVFDEKGLVSEMSTQPYEGGHQVYVSPEDAPGIRSAMRGNRSADTQTLVKSIQNQWAQENRGPGTDEVGEARANANSAEMETTYDPVSRGRRGFVDTSTGIGTPGDVVPKALTQTDRVKVSPLLDASGKPVISSVDNKPVVSIFSDPTPQTGWEGGPTSWKYGNRPAGENDKENLYPTGMDYSGRDIDHMMEQVRNGTYNKWVVDPLTQARIDNGKLQYPNTKKLMTSEQMDALETDLYKGLDAGGMGELPRLSYGTEWVGKYPNSKKSLPTLGANGAEYTVSPIGGEWDDVGLAKRSYTGQEAQSDALRVAVSAEEFANARNQVSQAPAEPGPTTDQVIANADAWLARNKPSDPAAPAASGPSRLAEMRARIARMGDSAARMAAEEQAAAPAEPVIPQAVAPVNTLFPVAGMGVDEAFPPNGGAFDPNNNPLRDPGDGRSFGTARNLRSPAGNIDRSAGDVINTVRSFADTNSNAYLPDKTAWGQRAYTRDGSGVTGAQYENGNGDVTVSSEVTKRALNLAKDGIGAALDQGNLDDMEAKELPSTIMKRVYTFIKSALDSELQDPTNMPARQAQVIAGKVASEIVGTSIGSLGMDKGDLADLGSSKPLSTADAIRSAMGADSEFAARVDRSGRTPEELAAGPGRVMQAGDNFYGIGEGTYAPGGGGRFGGFGGGGNVAGGIRSPYRETWGRIMQNVYMGSKVWDDTAGQVMKEAQAYASDQYAMQSMQTYGGNQAFGPSTYVSQASLVQYRIGQVASMEWGGVMSDVANFTKNQDALGLGTAAMSGVGVGGVIGVAGTVVGDWLAGGALGSAAAAAGGTIGALAWPVAAAAALGTGAYMLGNYQKDKTLRSAVMGETMPNSAIGSGTHAGDTAIAAYWKSQGTSHPMSEADLGSMEQDLARQDALKGIPPEAQKSMMVGYKLGDEAGSLADEYHLDVKSVLSSIGGLSAYVGGAANMDTIEALFNAGQADGMSADAEAQRVESIASGKGILMGSDEWNNLAKSITNQNISPQAREALQIRQQQQTAFRSQFSRYINSNNQMASANTIDDKYFGGNINAGQSQALSNLLASAQSSGINVNDTSFAPGAAQIVAGTNGTQWGNVAASLTSQAGAWGSQFGIAATQLAQGAQNAGINPGEFSAVVSGNPYVVSDRASVSGNYQWVTKDPNGTSVGSYQGDTAVWQAAYNTTGVAGPAVTSSNYQQQMTAAGLWVGDPTMQAAYFNGGSFGQMQEEQNRQYGFQMAGIGVGFQQIAWQGQYNWGANDGGTWQNPTANSMWGLQAQQVAVQWAGTQASEAYSKQSQQNSYQQFQVDKAYQSWSVGFDYQSNLMQRGFERQQYQYNMQTNVIQYGWQMQDIDEEIRRSSGYDRALLIRQKGRDTLSYNMETSQAEKVQSNQETMFKRQDEQYQKEIAHINATNALTEKNFAAQQTELDRQIKENQQLHDIQQEMIKLEHENQEKSMEFQKQSLGIQAAAAAEAHTYQQNLQSESKTHEIITNSLAKLSSSAPGIISMVQSLYGLSSKKFAITFDNNSRTFSVTMLP